MRAIACLLLLAAAAAGVAAAAGGAPAHGAGAAPRLRPRRRALQSGEESKASGRCVCVFDFNETLRVARGGREDAAAEDAAGVIDNCKVCGARPRCWRFNVS